MKGEGGRIKVEGGSFGRPGVSGCVKASTETYKYMRFHTRSSLVCQAIDADQAVGPDTVTLEPGCPRDVRKVGHYGTGDLEITLRSRQDLERARPLIQQSYKLS